MRISDWSSDVCSSDLSIAAGDAARASEHRLSRCPRHCPCTNCATLPTESAGGAMGFIFRSQLGTTPAPPLRAHPPSGVEDLDAEALVALALGLGLQDAHRAYLGGGADVGAAVGLLVANHDVDDADLGDRLGDQVDLGPDQVGIAERLAPREEADLNRSVGGDLGGRSEEHTSELQSLMRTSY